MHIIIFRLIYDAKLHINTHIIEIPTL